MNERCTITYEALVGSENTVEVLVERPDMDYSIISFHHADFPFYDGEIAHFNMWNFGTRLRKEDWDMFASKARIWESLDKSGKKRAWTLLESGLVNTIEDAVGRLDEVKTSEEVYHDTVTGLYVVLI